MKTVLQTQFSSVSASALYVDIFAENLSPKTRLFYSLHIQEPIPDFFSVKRKQSILF